MVSANELLEAVEKVLQTQSPLPFSQIAEGAGISEPEVARLLLRAMHEQRVAIDFKYPPIGGGAVIAVHRGRGVRA